MLTPETLTRHELIGLPVRVVDAASADLVGISGRVVSESMRTLTVRTDSGDKQVPKRGTTFEFRLVETPTVPGEDSPENSDNSVGDHTPACTDEPAGDHTPACTDEAAADRKIPGSTSELGSDTAGVRPRQSGPSESGTEHGSDSASQRGECQGVVYVTVDGTRLLSRPAERTERGVTTWR